MSVLENNNTNNTIFFHKRGCVNFQQRVKVGLQGNTAKRVNVELEQDVKVNVKLVRLHQNCSSEGKFIWIRLIFELMCGSSSRLVVLSWLVLVQLQIYCPSFLCSNKFRWSSFPDLLSNKKTTFLGEWGLDIYSCDIVRCDITRLGIDLGNCVSDLSFYPVFGAKHLCRKV